MIPYDDLVAALAAWRARQGLPVASTPTAGSGPTPTAVPNTGSGGYASSGYASGGSGGYASGGSGGYASYGSGPVAAKPGSGPTRGAPPAPPKGGGYQPPPLAPSETADDSLDVDDEALLEEAHYENEGADFGVPFNAERNDEESTTMGTAPERDSFGGETELDPGALSGKPKKPW